MSNDRSKTGTGPAAPQGPTPESSRSTLDTDGMLSEWGARLRAVVAPGHPLASLGRPATYSDLAPHVQLVLSDPVDSGGANYGVAGTRLWRFVDLGRRFDFLLAGFGWCRMPEHLVAASIAAGTLTAIEVHEDPTPPEGLTVYAAHRRDHGLGVAGRWLLDELRRSLVQ